MDDLSLFSDNVWKIHSVFQCKYYAKADSVILSAHDRQGNRIETVEFSSSQGKVIQSRGMCNSDTEYFFLIIYSLLFTGQELAVSP